MATFHYHYENGSAGCLPDSADVYARRRDAIAWAEQLFGGSLCDACFRDMSRSLRSREASAGVTYGFDSDCENESPDGGTCSAGADYVSITRESGGLRGMSGLVECACG